MLTPLKPLAFATLSALFAAAPAASQSLELQGQLSGWTILSAEDATTSVFGLRYLPTFTAEKDFSGERTADTEISANAYASGPIGSSSELEVNGRVKPYRVWGRYKTSRYEARVGLQKLNFGSATLLRPLMWFDSVDPRDPLQITDGVYAGLFRYYFPNKATIWGWGLYGNTSLKGSETNPTKEHTPEFGGRFELPVPRGQVSFTTHHREADLRRGLLGSLDRQSAFTPEHRYGLDGKWDLGIGFWFEGTLSHQTAPDVDRPDQRALDIGADYTFGLGNGLYVLGEYFLFDNSRGVLGPGEGVRLVATTLRYPIGLLDAVSGIFYFDWNRRDSYRFVSWQRTYDRWQFYVMGFWNPQQAAIRPGGGEQTVGRSPLSGRGAQLLAVFNHRWTRH
jgi:hypothetical protein